MATTKAKTTRAKTKKAKTKKAKTTRDRKRATLRLDAAIYKKAALNLAAEAFEQLARIEIRRDGRQQVVSFSRIEPDVADRLADEFANYALGCLVTQQ